MKKVISTLVIAVALLMALPTQAQVKFGLRAGANISNMKFSGAFEESNRAGFFVGPTVKFTLPVIGLSCDASAIYDSREAKIENETLSYKAIEIPLNVRYGIGLSSVANVFLFAGPQFGFNLSEDKANWSWKKADFSVNVGVGCTIASHYELKANYNISCTKSGETNSEIPALNGYSSKFNAWQVGLAYYF